MNRVNRVNFKATYLLLFLMANSAFGSEKNILLDGDLSAIHNDAQVGKTIDKPKAAVLMIHGWASQMNEVGDMYLHLANRLAVDGYASLRINVRGESEGVKTNFRLTSSFSSRLADAQVGFNYLQKMYPDTPIALVGFSLGGATALALTSNNPTKIDSMVLWSSAGNPSELVDSLPKDVVKKAMDKGQAKLKLWTELTLTREHIEGMLGHDIFHGLTQYNGALLSIRGSDDYLEPQESIIFKHANATPEEFILINGADHIYHSLTADAPYVEQVLKHTVNWFKDTMPVRQ
ncbi:alpha/beta hydrolase [Paraglaciecola sp.]|uniref:alpha/beta hydrolase n=1 Tax=Paraglaciecola sp. TaxID=1920173 RepID=UPI003EF78911